MNSRRIVRVHRDRLGIMGEYEVLIAEVWSAGSPATERASVAQPLQMVELPNIGAPVAPTFSLDPTAAQQMMDGLWDCGVRPSEGQGSAGQLAAVREHLADMRRLVFDKGLPPAGMDGAKPQKLGGVS